MKKRLVDIDTDEQKEIMREMFAEFKEEFQPVIEKYSDIHVTAKELGQLWCRSDGSPIHEQTIKKYSEQPSDPLPRLKNGKYSLKAACEWLYQSSWVKETFEGKKLYRQIAKKYKVE